VDLFYAPKAKIIEAFSNHELPIDYDDKLDEEEKAEIATVFRERFDAEAKAAVSHELASLLGKASLKAYQDRLCSALGALPQEIRFIARHDSSPRVFQSVNEASNFLKSPDFDFSNPIESYVYQATYTDGTEFEREVDSLQALRELHAQTERLAKHMSDLA